MKPHLNFLPEKVKIKLTTHRIEISSSNFPRFKRNLNTRGGNVTESEGITAHNKIHHSSKYPSQIRLPVVK